MAVTINGVNSTVGAGLAQATTELDNVLATITGGGDASPADLLAVQVGLAKFSVTTTAVSSIVKGISDDIKGVVQKI